MKAVCPKCDSTEFVTVAHVTEDWIVDENGTFLDVADPSDRQTTHGPDPGNIWTCTFCGTDAEVTE